MSLFSRLSSRVKRSPYAIYLVALSLICLILSPYAMNGFWGDDALNSQARFWAERTHGSIWDLSMRIFIEWIELRGRLMAGFLHGYFLFYFFSDLQSLRLAQCLSVLVNIGMFGYILWSQGFREKTILTWGILFVGLFQIGDALDPVAAFAFHYSFLTIQLFLPVIFLVKWSHDRSTRHLIIAMILWFWSMMYYEINFIFIPIALVFILKFSESSRRILQNMAVVAVPVMLYGGLTYYLRSHAVNADYDGSNFGQLKLFPLTYLKQLTSSFPLSVYLLGQHYRALDPLELLRPGLQSKTAWSIFILGILFFYTSVTALHSEWHDVKGRFQIFVIGSVMLFLPPAIMALAARYQNEIGWGHGTLCQYYQYFGVAILLAWLLSLAPLRNRWIRLSVAVSLSTYLALNTTMNMQTIARFDAEYFRGPRELFLQQARAGLLSSVRDGDIIEISGAPHYVNANLIYEGSGKNVFVPNDAPPWFAKAPTPQAKRFILTRNSSGKYELAIPMAVIKKEPVYHPPFEISTSSFVGQKNTIRYNTEELVMDESKLHIAGWAFAEDSPRPDLEGGLILESSHHKMFFPFTKAPRPDVKASLGAHAPDSSGFTLSVSRALLKPALYHAAIGFYNKRSRVFEYKTPIPGADIDNVPADPDDSLLEFEPGTMVKVAEFELGLDQLQCSFDRLLVNGWAHDGKRPGKSISIVLKSAEGKYWYGKTKRVLRDDVAAHFKNPALANAGFSGRFSTLSIPEGEYQAGVLLMENVSGSLKFIKSVSVRHSVDPAVKPMTDKYVEGPLHVMFDVMEESDRQIKVTGWAIMKDRDSKNCKISLLFKTPEGIVYHAALSSVLRRDVTSYLNNTYNFDDSGFETIIPKAALPVGKYQIGIQITYPGSATPVAQFTDRYVERRF